MNLNKDKAPEKNQEVNQAGSVPPRMPVAPAPEDQLVANQDQAQKQPEKAVRVDHEPEVSSEKGEKLHEYDPSAPIGDLIEAKPYQMSEKGKALRKHLASQALVRVLVIREPNEPKDALLPFSVNGYNFFVAKGKYSNVPEDVAAMIQDTYKQGEAVLADHPLNLNNNSAAANEFKR